MEIAEALRLTRNESGKSQEYMAFELGVSRRTIQHWESGITEPSIGQTIRWFQLVDKNPTPYLLQHLYPMMDHISAKDEDDKIRSALQLLISELPISSVRQLMYLFYGNHGSSPHAILQLLNAYLQTPMRDRVTQASIIIKNYEIAMRKNILAQPEHVQPDLEFLHAALEEGEEAILRDAQEYTMTTNKK